MGEMGTWREGLPPCQLPNGQVLQRGSCSKPPATARFESLLFSRCASSSNSLDLLLCQVQSTSESETAWDSWPQGVTTHTSAAKFTAVKTIMITLLTCNFQHAEAPADCLNSQATHSLPKVRWPWRAIQPRGRAASHSPGSSFGSFGVLPGVRSAPARPILAPHPPAARRRRRAPTPCQRLRRSAPEMPRASRRRSQHRSAEEGSLGVESSRLGFGNPLGQMRFCPGVWHPGTWHRMAQDGTRWHKMAQDGTRWHKMAQDGTRWHKMAQDGTRWHKMAQAHAQATLASVLCGGFLPLGVQADGIGNLPKAKCLEHAAV